MTENANALVSIVIPTYKGERFLPETVESALKQSHPAVEVLVVNDCSPDGTAPMLRARFAGDPRVTLIDNEVNRGFTASCNIGLRASRGGHVIFLGHDDLLPPHHVARLLPEFEDGVVLVHCNARVIDADGNFLKMARDDEEQRRKTADAMFELAKDNFIQSCGLMIRRDAMLRSGGFDEGYHIYGEWLNYVRLLEQGRAKYSTQSCGLYRRHDTNITNSFVKKKNMLPLLRYHNFCRLQAMRRCRPTPARCLEFLRSFLHSNCYFLAKRIL